MEKVAIKSSSTQAKVLGTIVSITGAFIVTLYKGPPIIILHRSLSLHQPTINILRSVDRNWAIGGLLLTVEYTLVPLWYIVQVQFFFYCYRELQCIIYSEVKINYGKEVAFGFHIRIYEIEVDTNMILILKTVF